MMRDALELDDWGGTGPVLHLAHANGFPPGTYRKLIELLKTRYHVFTLRSRCLVPGSDPLTLGSWTDLADELAHSLRARGLENVVGVGHSVGGVATLLASVRSTAAACRSPMLSWLRRRSSSTPTGCSRQIAAGPKSGFGSMCCEVATPRTPLDRAA